jgi:hypothetical protein
LRAGQPRPATMTADTTRRRPAHDLLCDEDRIPSLSEEEQII